MKYPSEEFEPICWNSAGPKPSAESVKRFAEELLGRLPSEDVKRFAEELLGRLPSEDVRRFAQQVKGAVQPPQGAGWRFAQQVLGSPASCSSEQEESIAMEESPTQVLGEDSALHEGTWDPAKHPRGGFSQNRGWFSLTAGTGGSPNPNLRRQDLPSRLVVPVMSRPQSFNGKTQAERRNEVRHHLAAVRRSLDGAPSEESAGAESEPEHEKLTGDDLRVYFRLIYGGKGQKLLRAFEASDGILKTESLWINNSELNTRAGKRPKQIRVHDGLDPVQAAQELMGQLIKSIGLTEVRQKLDHTGFDNIETLKDSYRQSVKRAASTVAFASELYLSGMTIANEGADFVVSVQELLDGNLYALVSLLPLVPVGATLILKHGDQVYRIRSLAMNAIRNVPIDQIVAFLQSTKRLERNMIKAGLKKSANTATHHIVPAALKKFQSAADARAILAKFGISADSISNGVFLPAKKLNESIDAILHGKVHPKRYCDELLKRLEKATSKKQVLGVLV